MTSSHQDGYLLWIKIGNLSILPISTICHHVWKNGEKMIPNWFHLIQRVCLKLHPIWYVILESLLRIKLGYLFPSKFISKRPYIVLVKPKPKYHGLGVS
jgi:hypothetical protein